MPQPYFEMEESRSVTPWVNRLYFESPRASSFLGLRLVKARHKNLVPLLSGVKPDPMVGSGRYAEPIPVKCPSEAMPCRGAHKLVHQQGFEPGTWPRSWSRVLHSTTRPTHYIVAPWRQGTLHSWCAGSSSDFILFPTENNEHHTQIRKHHL